MEPAASRSSKDTISALMKACSKSVWITPAALGGGVALVDGPGAGFFGAGGEVGLQAQGVEAHLGERVEAGFGLADGFEEFLRFVVVKL